MKKLLLGSLLLMSCVSQADIIKCVFTEPFVGSTYSMTQSTLTYKNIENKTQVIKNVSFQIKAAGEFELVGKNGKVLQKISLNGKGSDGMSDRVFPYEVIDSGMGLMTANGYGGCTSNYLKASGNN